jgi:hypothetical protein
MHVDEIGDFLAGWTTADPKGDDGRAQAAAEAARAPDPVTAANPAK